MSSTASMTNNRRLQRSPPVRQKNELQRSADWLPVGLWLFGFLASLAVIFVVLRIGELGRFVELSLGGDRARRDGRRRRCSRRSRPSIAETLDAPRLHRRPIVTLQAINPHR